eukprot:scaffold54323_cov18-Tisochrysis_lutea.AAC.3
MEKRLLAGQRAAQQGQMSRSSRLLGSPQTCSYTNSQGKWEVNKVGGTANMAVMASELCSAQFAWQELKKLQSHSPHHFLELPRLEPPPNLPYPDYLQPNLTASSPFKPQKACKHG